MPSQKVPGPNDTETVKHIRNKQKRQEVFSRIKKQKADIRKSKKAQKQKDVSEGKVVEKKVPKTLDNMREADETMLTSDDEEIVKDQDEDEFRAYFDGEQPKTIITTNDRPSRRTINFVRALLTLIPGSYYYARRNFEIKKICEWAGERGFTNLIVLGQGLQLGGNKKFPCSMLLVHLPEGPTLNFRISNVRLPEEIKNHARATKHKPELILNNFNTRLGLRVSRALAALFPQDDNTESGENDAGYLSTTDPEFTGRRVVTFHCQRDYLFVRHHRYIFPEEAEGQKARLQEMGPRFTLKLRSLQAGPLDSSRGEYEWINPPDGHKHKKRFLL